MATKFWILVFLACVVLAKQKEEFPIEEGIKVLTPESFGKAYKKYNQLIIEYYAPWCGQCKNFAPQYTQLARLLPRMVPGMTLTKLDCEAHGEFCQQQGVESYPTLVYYDNGKEKHFKGRPSTESLMEWIDGMQHPIEVINSYARLHHRRKKNDHSIVLVAKNDSHYADMFRELSIEIPDFKWFHYMGEESSPLSLHPPKVLIKNSESENLTFDLDSLKDKQKIKEKIDIHRYPKLKKYEDPAIASMIFERNKPVVLYLADSETTYLKDKQVLDQLNEKFLETSPVVIFIKDNVGKQAERFLSYFGVKKFPFVLYMKQIKYGDMVKHYFRGQLNLKELTEFVEQAEGGKLKHDYKSEDKPVNNDGPVRKLVGSDFRDVVNNERNVIVTYTMNDCNICDDFVPTFQEVAAEYKKAGKDLLFAIINNKENDSGVPVMGFPAIKLHKKGTSSKPAEFIDKDRTKAQLLAFLSREGFGLNEPKKEAPNTDSQTTKSAESEKPKQESVKSPEQAQAPMTETKKPADEPKKAAESPNTDSTTKKTDQAKSSSPTSQSAQGSTSSAASQKAAGEAKTAQK